MLKLSNRDLKITMINILNNLDEKMDNINEHVGNASEATGTIKKSQMKKHIRNEEFP